VNKALRERKERKEEHYREMNKRRKNVDTEKTVDEDESEHE